MTAGSKCVKPHYNFLAGKNHRLRIDFKLPKPASSKYFSHLTTVKISIKKAFRYRQRLHKKTNYLKIHSLLYCVAYGTEKGTGMYLLFCMNQLPKNYEKNLPLLCCSRPVSYQHKKKNVYILPMFYMILFY